MLHSKARWQISESDEAAARQMAEALRVEPLIAKLLVVRGIDSVDQAQRFLQADADHVHDPFLLDGMEAAIARIRAALAAGEKIRVYGDYDADGVSSTSLMVWLLRQVGAEHDSYIPHRVNEGYGLNKPALALAKEQGVSLLITVDTGISAREEIAFATEIGLDVIVTDHHEPPELLPECAAVINPKKPGCPYPFKQLAGVGVAFKLAHALLGRFPEELLEMATIGTVADLMPLVDENRILVKLGLSRMQNSDYAGIRALLGTAGIDPSQVNATHVGFSLAPRINAGGRLDSAEDAVRLLVSTNEDEAQFLADGLDMLNKERQRIVEDMTKEALQLLEESLADNPSVIVLAKEGWNVGVIGIVASKVLEKWYRPTIILGIDPETGKAKGSARSIAGFDIYRALSQCADLFDHFGGHQAAAGMSLSGGKIDELRKRLQEIASEQLSEEDLMPIMQADAFCTLAEMPVETIRQLNRLAPFGMGNPQPKFIFSGLSVGDKKKIGKEQQHLRLQLNQTVEESACTVEAIGFGRGAVSELISSSALLDVLGELSINEWNGMRKPQIVVQDIRIREKQMFDWRGGDLKRKFADLDIALQAMPKAVRKIGIVLFGDADKVSPPAGLMPEASVWRVSREGELTAAYASDGAEEPITAAYDALTDLILFDMPLRMEQLRSALAAAEGAERIFAIFRDPEPDAASTLPSRDMFKQVYGVIQRQSGFESYDTQLLTAFSKRSGLPVPSIRFIVDVFVELGFIEKTEKGIRLVASPGKKDLSEAAVYQDKVHREQIEQALLYSSSQEMSDWMRERFLPNDDQPLEGIV
ncbi:single-stranded-DNA-specific exonuclease RecJ [Paenibacillus sp. MBLB4367]|uniref:single-stranded-DNA-specific exonuclease RecJ n=1 Tax=Paenibacillus sp. MBLB4367 TaxID=3384767 RepID=UPI0039082331